MKNTTQKFPALFLLGIVLLLSACADEKVQQEVIRPVKVMVVDDSSEGIDRTFPGTTRAAARAELSFRVPGPLVQLPISEGERISRGELLAQIDPRDFQTAVDNLEASLAGLQAQRKAMNQARPEDIRRLEASLTAAEARLLEAEATFKRYQRLYENENISKAEYDQRRAARDVARADVRTAEETLEIARSGARIEDIEAKDAEIRATVARLQKAKDELKDTSLRAPYDGIVAQRYVDNFEFVQAQQKILSLQNLDTMELVTQIPETIIATARERDIAEEDEKRFDFFAQFPSLPGLRIPAEISEIAAQADPTTRTYSVTFQMKQPENGRILAGMTGEIAVKIPGISSQGYPVPVSAVFTTPNGSHAVWKLDTTTMMPEETGVAVGEMMDDNIMILSGLSEGDTVITAGASFLSESQKVRIITDELRERR